MVWRADQILIGYGVGPYIRIVEYVCILIYEF